jgi:hypothetical protein
MAYELIEAAQSRLRAVNAPSGRARPRCGKVRKRQLGERPDKTTKEKAV